MAGSKVRFEKRWKDMGPRSREMADIRFSYQDVNSLVRKRLEDLQIRKLRVREVTTLGRQFGAHLKGLN